MWLDHQNHNGENNCTDPLQHAHDVACVVEGTNLLVAAAVHNGHGLKAHTFHGDFGRQQKAVVQVIEEFIAGRETQGNIRIQKSHWQLKAYRLVTQTVKAYRDHAGDSKHSEITLVTQSIQGSHWWLEDCRDHTSNSKNTEITLAYIVAPMMKAHPMHQQKEAGKEGWSLLRHSFAWNNEV